jgi:hypothetical protein
MEGSTMANTSRRDAANPTATQCRAGAGRPAAGAFLRAPLALAAAVLLLAGTARAQQAADQDEDQNLVQAPAPGEEPPAPPLPAGETQWAGDDTSAFGQEQAPDGEGDAYSQGYQDGKKDALADQTHGPTMDDFHSSLDQSGQWEQTTEYGAVWRPQVDSGWRPYTNGSWVYTSYGWTWASSEPWGWAAYHYGRWILLPGGFWAWIPGRVWAPAWVAWRWGGGYAGWAPLGPRGAIYWHSQAWWTCVEQRHFLHPIRSVMLPQDRHAGIFGQLRPVRPIYGRVGGPTRGWVGGAVGHPIAPTRVETVSHPGQAHSQAGGILHIYAPQTRPIARSYGGPATTGVGRAAERSNNPRWMPAPKWGGTPGAGAPPPRGDSPGNTNPRGPAPHAQPQPRPEHGWQPQGSPPSHENRGGAAQPHGSPQGGGHPAGQPPQPHVQPAPHPSPAPAPAPPAQPTHEHHEKKDK